MLRRLEAGFAVRFAAPLALVCLLAGAGSARAAIFPAQLGDYTRHAPQTVSTPDLPLLREFGLEASEEADYASPSGKRFIATAWRFQDSTGAMAFFEAHRPSGAVRSQLGRLGVSTPEDQAVYGNGVLYTVNQLAVTTSDGVIYAYGNYVFQFTGGLPAQDSLAHLYEIIPKFERSALPGLMAFLPSENLIPNSERYVLGPVSLQRFDAGIPPSVAAFHLDSEAQLGSYKTPQGDMTLAIFEYPTPDIARDRDTQFEKLPGAVAKRSGPLVAVILNAPNADAAERLLSLIRYDQNITWSESLSLHPVKDAAVMILTILALTGILLGICLIAGVGFGAFRVVLRKLGWDLDERNAMITLHLADK